MVCFLLSPRPFLLYLHHLPFSLISISFPFPFPSSFCFPFSPTSHSLSLHPSCFPLCSSLYISSLTPHPPSPFPSFSLFLAPPLPSPFYPPPHLPFLLA